MRNIMTALKFFITFFFVLLAIQCFSQTNFNIRRRKLTPTFFDTTADNIFVFETPPAIIYFRQKDIADLINNPNSKTLLGPYSYKTFQDTLQTNTKNIRVKDVLYFYTDAQRDSIFKIDPVNSMTKKLNEEFYFIGAALILDGEFMVFSKDKKAFITRGLLAKKQKGYSGQETLEFYLPDKKQFYYIVTALGE